MTTSFMKKLFEYGVWYSGLYHCTHFVLHTFFPNRFVILMYHRVCDPASSPAYLPQPSATPEQFAMHMEYLSEYYDVLTFEKLSETCEKNYLLPRRSALITFDDGYRDVYTHAFPLLQQYHFPALIALATGPLDSHSLFWWDAVSYCCHHTTLHEIALEGLGRITLDSPQKRNDLALFLCRKFKTIPHAEKERLLLELTDALEVTLPKSSSLLCSWEEILTMSKQSISFSPHTVHHPILTQVSETEAQEEITDSLHALRSVLDSDPRVFTYPNGRPEDMSEQLDTFIRSQGFSFALSTVQGIHKPSSHLFTLKRIAIGSDDSMKMFRIKLLGIHLWPSNIKRWFFG